MENSTKKMSIEIWSDVVCPFCFLGKRKFENTLKQFKNKDDLNIVWKSFQLNPDVRTDTSMSVYTYLSRSKGISEDVARKMTRQIMDRGKEVGIEYNFDATKVNNTFRAHCFLHFSADKNKQNDAKELLLKSYFEKGANVDDVEVLLQLGSNLGFNEQELKIALESGKYQSAVLEDMDLAAKFGIRGVPFFVFDRKYAISGAQESPVFLETLNKAFGEWQLSHAVSELDVTNGDSCSTENDNCL